MGGVVRFGKVEQSKIESWMLVKPRDDSVYSLVRWNARVVTFEIGRSDTLDCRLAARPKEDAGLGASLLQLVRHPNGLSSDRPPLRLSV